MKTEMCDKDYSQVIKDLEKVYEINKETASFFRHCLYSEKGMPCLDYLHKKRNISVGTINEFELGYADEKRNSLIEYLSSIGYTLDEIKDAGLCKEHDGQYYDVFSNRLVIPIVDERSRIIGFGGRSINQDAYPKYIFTHETTAFNKRHILYNLNSIRKDKVSNFIILAEGFMDVIALSMYGFKNTVATLGTSLTDHQIKLFSNYVNTVYISFDGDIAGVKAALRASEKLEQQGIESRIIFIPNEMDPAEYLTDCGNDGYELLMSNAYDINIFKLFCEQNGFELGTQLRYTRAK